MNFGLRRKTFGCLVMEPFSAILSIQKGIRLPVIMMVGKNFITALLIQMNRNNLINIPGMKGFIRKVAAFISEKQGYETIGNGSTGHKAYCNAESLKLTTLRSAY